MGSPTEKVTNFLLEPMGEKAVNEIPGIGETYAIRLYSLGYNKAYLVLGQYLILKKNKELFIDWLKLAAGASTYHAEHTYACLTAWCSSFL